MCKAAVSRDSVIPIYSAGNENQQDPREKVPPRPQAQREEADEERPQVRLRDKMLLIVTT